MKRIISIFDSLKPVDVIAVVCVCVIGAFLFMIVTGCGEDTPKDNEQTSAQDAPEPKDDQDKKDQDEEEEAVPKIGPLGHVFMNYKCCNNLKNIKIALVQYECKYKTLPDRGGDLFLAKLYLTGDVTDWDVFICPADAAKNKAAFVLEEIFKKCPPPFRKWMEYEEYLDEDYEGDVQKSHYALDVEADLVMSMDAENRTFKPGEISYAAVWNMHGSEDEDELEGKGWTRKYEITSVSCRRKKPVVCDDFEGANGETTPMIHGDHVNVLYSNGEIGSVKNIKNIGQDSNLKREGFDALRN